MQILESNFLIYTICGVWRPIECSTTCVKLFYYMYTTFVVISMGFLVMGQFLDIVLVADNIEKIIQNDLLFVGICTVCCKATIAITRRNAIFDLVQTLLTEPCKPQGDDEVAIQLRFNEFIRSCTLKYTLLAMGSVTSITLASIANAMQGILPYQVWLPYDSNKPSLFWMTSIHQLITTIYATIINVGTETLIFGFVLQICAQLEIFECRLHKITTSNTARCFSSSLSKGTRTLISKYIRHHLKIYKYAKDLNNVFNEVLFVQFFGSILALCTSVYFISTHVTDSEAIGFLIYTICMFVQIYIYCWSGNEVILKSSSVGNAVYHIDWTLLSVSERRDLLMIMKRSTIPIKFTSSFLITLSLQSYSSVGIILFSVYSQRRRRTLCSAILKMSYSAFNLLQQ